MNLFTLSWKNMLYKPWSTALTLILFALGVGLVILLLLLQDQIQRNFEKNLAGIDLVIGAKGSPLQLILSSMYHIDAPTGNITLGNARPFLNPNHPLIQKAVPISLGDSYRGRRIVGTDTAILSLYDAELAAGKIWADNFEMTIGAEAAQNLNLQLGDEFKSTHGLLDEDGLEHADSEPFKVVGILKPSGTVIDQLLLTTNQSYWIVHDHEHGSEGDQEDGHHHEEEAHHHEEDGHHHDEEGHHHEEGAHHHDEEGHHHASEPTGLLEADPDQEITALLIQYKNRSNFQVLNMGRNINENTDMQAANPPYEINRLFSLMDAGERTLRILAIVIVIVSGLSIFISLFSSLRNRRYELALLRVMGGHRNTLFSLILIEGLLLAAAGGLLGIVLAHLGMELTGRILQESYRYSFSGFQWLPEEGLVIAASLAIGFVSALIPAWQAAQTDIAQTLTEG